MPKVYETLPNKFNLKMLNIKMDVHIINVHWQAILLQNKNIYHHSVIKKKKKSFDKEWAGSKAERSCEVG